jgi:hypothetical protein
VIVSGLRRVQWLFDDAMEIQVLGQIYVHYVKSM